MLTIVQVEKEARHVFVIDPATSVCLVLGNQLLKRRHNKHHKLNTNQAESS